MCKWGTSLPLRVTIPAHLSHTGEAREKVVDIDACIQPLVKALNEGGVPTIASCCGHKMGFGSIVLGDGRELLVCPDYDTARRVEKLNGIDIHGAPFPAALSERQQGDAAFEALRRVAAYWNVETAMATELEIVRAALRARASTEE